MIDLFHRFAELADSGLPFVIVTVTGIHGSTPTSNGAKMGVTANGLDCGTVGGGKLEAQALEFASEMLQHGPNIQVVDWSLKADLGMTCGGRVQLLFERIHARPWQIVIFGAGHVTQALANLLVTLPCQLTCIDPRKDWLEKLPTNARHVHTDDPAAEVARLADETFVLCMTQGHRSDLPVLRALYMSSRVFPYVGVIGSQAKSAVLRSELLDLGIQEERLHFHCPVGLPIGSNAPNEIAVSIAAQLLEKRP